MSFLIALNNILTEQLPANLLTAEEITTRNFTEDCATHNILVNKIQFGGYKEDYITDDGPEYFLQTVKRAYVSAYMPKSFAQQFIDNINLEGNCIAEKIKYVRDDMYETIYPSLIPHVPTSYQRRHTSTNTISTIPFEVDSNYNLLVNKTNYEYFLSEFNITNYDDIGYVLILDPKSGREANAYPGLFSEIGKAVRRIETENY